MTMKSTDTRIHAVSVNLTDNMIKPSYAVDEFCRLVKNTSTNNYIKFKDE